MGRGASSALVLVRRCVVYTSSPLYQAGQLFQGDKNACSIQMGAGNYVEKIATIFPNIKALRVSPFHGMTGIILQNKNVGLISVSEAICCVEVGVMRTPTCSLAL